MTADAVKLGKTGRPEQRSNSKRKFVVWVPSDASSSFTGHGRVEVRHEGGGICGPLSDARRLFFLLNFDLSSITLVCHPSFSLQGPPHFCMFVS